MRRLPLLLLALYLVFLGGSTYYTQIFAVRIAHHVIMTVLLVGWLVIRARRRGLPPTPINPLLYVTIAVWLIASAFALDPRIAFESAWFPITHVILFFFIVALLHDGRQRLLMEVVFLMGAVVIIAALVQVWQWLAGWLPLLGSDLPIPPVLPRLDQPFGVSTWLSAYAAPMIVLSAAWALTVRRKDYRAPLWGLAAAFGVVLVFTVSRGGYISLAVAAGLLIAFRLWSRKALNRLIPVVIGGGIVLVGLSAVILLISRDFSRQGGDALRTDLWRTSLEMVRADPLTGVGVGNFGRGHRNLRDGSYVDDRLSTAHDVYLDSTAELGIPGILLWIALIVVGARAWWAQWRAADSDGRKLRLEAAAAALIGIGVHSLFDMFTLTSSVLLPLVLIAYCIAPARMLTDAPLQGRRLPAALLAVLIGVFGVGLLLSDRAQAAFNSSVSTGSLADAQTAYDLDPSLRLYSLQIDYLTARDPLAPPAQQIEAYQAALGLEPTWDTGWLNLAALQMTVDDAEDALDSFHHAATISNWNNGWFAWAQLAEQLRAAPPDAITAAYLRSLYSPPTNPDFWNATTERQNAAHQFADAQPLEARYRTYATLDPAAAAVLVPGDPHSAEEWWVVGHHALTVDHDSSAALAAFDHAIAAAPAHGDYYTWRAYARPPGDQAGIRRDLAIAQQLGEVYDSIALARVDLAASDAARREAQIAIVGAQVVQQNFEAVLFDDRRAQFLVLPIPAYPMVSETDLRAWYGLAQDFASSGDSAHAEQVYRLLLEFFPSQIRAQQVLTTLEGNAP